MCTNLIFFPSILDSNVDIDELDIAVNAVATAVKDFFFKRLPPILGPEDMAELEAISRKSNLSEGKSFVNLSGQKCSFLFELVLKGLFVLNLQRTDSEIA